MKKILGLALSGVMALGLTAATGAPAQASETSAQSRQEKRQSYRYRVHTKVWPYSWGGRRGGVKVRVYRRSYEGRLPVPYIRVCLQRKTPYRFRTVDCDRTNRWGRVDFRMVDRISWDSGDRRTRGLRRSGKNFSNWYRVVVPPTYRNYGHVSRPFRLWDRWGWNDDDNGYDDYRDNGYDDDDDDGYGSAWRRTSRNR